MLLFLAVNLEDLEIFMFIKCTSKLSADIDDEVINTILNFYPEEKLIEHPTFKKAFKYNYIQIEELKEFSRKIFIPWQMFFLNKKNLKKELEEIEKNRADKFSSRFLTKRLGMGRKTSMRIVDRLIRLQTYVVNSQSLPFNAFCGSLKGMSPPEAASHLLFYFEIERKKFREKSDIEGSLHYLIKKVEEKNINICRGVLANGMLPVNATIVSDVYKNTSGFAIKDERLPFIFLPSEINKDEVAYRQIYTLLYLLVAIGTERFEYFIEKKFSFKEINGDKIERFLHMATSEILFPEEESEKLRGIKINEPLLKTLVKTTRSSPTAVLTILLFRKIITRDDYERLKPPPFSPTKNILEEEGHFNYPKITTSVHKFCGTVASDIVNNQLKNKKINPKPAQYLLLGRVNGEVFKKYLKEIGM